MHYPFCQLRIRSPITRRLTSVLALVDRSVSTLTDISLATSGIQIQNLARQAVVDGNNEFWINYLVLSPSSLSRLQ